jgi:RNA polymerase sigma-70 factor (ECF subfamily)
MDAVWSVARRLATDPASAEDLVQETFLRAYRSFGSQGRGSMRSWLITICVNVSRSDYRRSQRRPQEDLGAEPPRSYATEDVTDLVLGRLDRAAVARGLAQLPESKRVAVTLVDIGGLTMQEAADVARVPLGTMLSRVHRGRQQLGRLIQREGLGNER